MARIAYVVHLPRTFSWDRMVSGAVLRLLILGQQSHRYVTTAGVDRALGFLSRQRKGERSRDRPALIGALGSAASTVRRL